MKRRKKKLLPECHGVVTVQLEIEIVEFLALAAVDLVHPLAYPRLLIEHRTVETQELYIHYLV